MNSAAARFGAPRGSYEQLKSRSGALSAGPARALSRDPGISRDVRLAGVPGGGQVARTRVPALSSA